MLCNESTYFTHLFGQIRWDRKEQSDLIVDATKFAVHEIRSSCEDGGRDDLLNFLPQFISSQKLTESPMVRARKFTINAI